MEVTCSDCGQRYSVDDSKISETGFTYITCPRCKGKIKLENPLSVISPNEIKDTLTGKLEEGFDAGVKTALVYTEEPTFEKRLQDKLTALSYETRQITTPIELTVRFRYHTYDLVFLQQKGNNVSPPMQDVLQAIHKLPSEVRRKTLVFLVTPDGSRNDSFRAFLYGVDMMLAPTDLEQLERIIAKAETTKKDRYKIFNDCIQKLTENML